MATSGGGGLVAADFVAKYVTRIGESVVSADGESVVASVIGSIDGSGVFAVGRSGESVVTAPLSSLVVEGCPSGIREPVFLPGGASGVIGASVETTEEGPPDSILASIQYIEIQWSLFLRCWTQEWFPVQRASVRRRHDAVTIPESVSWPPSTMDDIDRLAGDGAVVGRPTADEELVVGELLLLTALADVSPYPPLLSCWQENNVIFYIAR